MVFFLSFGCQRTGLQLEFAQIPVLPVAKKFGDPLVKRAAQKEILVRHDAVQTSRARFVGRESPPANDAEPGKGIPRQMGGYME
jgi:hypothetical protein